MYKITRSDQSELIDSILKEAKDFGSQEEMISI